MCVLGIYVAWGLLEGWGARGSNPGRVLYMQGNELYPQIFFCLFVLFFPSSNAVSGISFLLGPSSLISLPLASAFDTQASALAPLLLCLSSQVPILNPVLSCVHCSCHI